MPAEANIIAWQDGNAHLGGHCIGLAVCKVVWVETCMTYLQRQPREVSDFFVVASGCDDPLVFVEFLATATLVDPTMVTSSALGFAPRGLFFNMTDHSLLRFLGGGDGDAQV